MKLPIRRSLIGTLASALLFASTAASAQDYPNRPVRMVTPIAAGGMTDVVSRVVGARLAERLGQPVVIENRAGAGGRTAQARGAASAPRWWPVPRPTATRCSLPTRVRSW
jgi:tripartite-type tricarboxylate transporter receptor subunit TctC